MNGFLQPQISASHQNLGATRSQDKDWKTSSKILGAERRLGFPDEDGVVNEAAVGRTPS